jgi:hypothetical protein
MRYLTKAWQRAVFCAALLSSVAWAADKLTPLVSGGGPAVPTAWRVLALPNSKKPVTEFDVIELEGKRVLRVRTDKSYGALVHDYKGAPKTISWRWRLEQPLLKTDLQTKAGDDSALKVCVLFDMPMDKVPAAERNFLRVSNWFSDEAMPTATLCYVWDHSLPVGTELANAYTQRLHMLVVNSGEAQLRRWVSHTRDIAADFKKSFGQESDTVPPVLGIAVVADADNTQSSSLAYVAEINLAP